MFIVIFLVLIALGLAAFGFLFFKEWKSGAFADDPSSVTLRPLTTESEPRLRDVKPSDPSPAVAQMASHSVPDTETNQVLVDKCSKLEQLLEEKNHLLRQLELELASEKSHRGEFESMRDILQSQLEDLKVQNKKLKEELAQALKSTLESRPMAVEKNEIDMRADFKPAPEASKPKAPSAEDGFEQFFSPKKSADASLSLHDIFENPNKNKPAA